MEAAKDSRPAGTITPVAIHHVIGLLAATGMRRSEATGLTLQDWLRIRAAKTGRQRLVPLHGTVREAFDRYLRVRQRCSRSRICTFATVSSMDFTRPRRWENRNVSRRLAVRSVHGQLGVRMNRCKRGQERACPDSARHRPPSGPPTLPYSSGSLPRDGMMLSLLPR